MNHLDPRELRIRAGYSALLNHSLTKEHVNPEVWYEEHVIDAIADILTYICMAANFKGDVDIERIFRCVRTHLTAELDNSVAGLAKLKWKKAAKSTKKPKKAHRMKYCTCGNRVQENGVCDSCDTP